MLIVLPLPSSLQRDVGAIVDAALDAAVDGVTVGLPTDTIVSSWFCVPLAFTDTNANAAVAVAIAAVVVVVVDVDVAATAAAAATVTANTLFTDDLLCNRNKNKQTKEIK